MGWWVHVKVVVIALISTYPFVALVQTLTNLEHFLPCEDGCIFLRYVGTYSLPSSRVQNLVAYAGSNSSERRWEIIPRFVYIRNGHPIMSASLFQSFGPFRAAFAAVAAPSLFPLSAITAVHEQDWDFCNPDYWPPDREVAICDSQEMKSRVKNHLADRFSLYLYIGALLAWAALKIAHDSALIAGWCQYNTIRLGLMSWVAQSFSCLFSFWWSLGTTEVFTAQIVVNSTCSACYYRLPTVAVLLAMSTPLLLLYSVASKLIAIVRSIHFGDYLYTVQYDVPFHVVAAGNCEDPTQSLLRPILGDAGSTQPRGLTFAERYFLYVFYRRCAWVWALSVFSGVGALVFGPLFLRLLLLTTRATWAEMWHLRLVLLVVALGMPLVTARVIVTDRWRNLRGLFSRCSVDRHDYRLWRDIVAHGLLMAIELTVASTPIVLLPPLICGTRPDIDEEDLNRSWSYSCAGVYILFAFHQSYWLLFARNSHRALQIKVLVNPAGWSPKDWRKLAVQQPILQLGESVAIAEEFDAGKGEVGHNCFESYLAAQRLGRLGGLRESYCDLEEDEDEDEGSTSSEELGSPRARQLASAM